MTPAPAGSDALAAPTFDESPFADDWSLRVIVRREGGGPAIASEQVTEADLAEARAEVWFNGFLRKGEAQTPYERLTMRLAPVMTEDRCLGFVLEARDEGRAGQAPGRFRQAFGVTALAPFAQRAADALVKQEVLKAGDLYQYGIEPLRQAPPRPARALGWVKVTFQAKPLRYEVRALEPLLAEARVVGDLDEAAFPVVFSESALGRAERFARKGADRRPPVETGALLVGTLFACPASGEMYLGIHEAIEVFDATQQEFALIYTSRTWSRVQAMLRRFDAACVPRRLVGQAHGHNFVLDGAPCAACATAKECPRTTVFVSAADRAFMRAVFARQPWAVCWIAGTNARGENVAALYTARGGVLRQRGYHVVADERLSTITTS